MSTRQLFCLSLLSCLTGSAAAAQCPTDDGRPEGDYFRLRTIAGAICSLAGSPRTTAKSPGGLGVLCPTRRPTLRRTPSCTDLDTTSSPIARCKSAPTIPMLAGARTTNPEPEALFTPPANAIKAAAIRMIVTTPAHVSGRRDPWTTYIAHTAAPSRPTNSEDTDLWSQQATPTPLTASSHPSRNHTFLAALPADNHTISLASAGHGRGFRRPQAPGTPRTPLNAAPSTTGVGRCGRLPDISDNSSTGGSSTDDSSSEDKHSTTQRSPVRVSTYASHPVTLLLAGLAEQPSNTSSFSVDELPSTSALSGAEHDAGVSNSLNSLAGAPALITLPYRAPSVVNFGNYFGNSGNVDLASDISSGAGHGRGLTTPRTPIHYWEIFPGRSYNPTHYGK